MGRVWRDDTIDDVHSIYLASESKVDQARDRFALTEGYISCDEAGSPWVPLNEGVWLRYVTFDVRSSTCANVMWVREEGSVGRHRHRGPVPGSRSRAAGVTSSTTGSPRRATTSVRARPESHLVLRHRMKTLFTLNARSRCWTTSVGLRGARRVLVHQPLHELLRRERVSRSNNELFL